MRTIDRHALRFVEGRGIAVIDRRITLRRERHLAPAVEPHCHALRRDVRDRPQRAVLHAQRSLVAQEHAPVARGEVAMPAVGRERHVLAQLAGHAKPVSRLHVQLSDLGIGVSENDAGLVGIGPALAIPTVDQFGTCSVASVHGMDHAVRGIGIQRLRSTAGRQRPRRFLLPVLALPANLGDLGCAMPLGDRPERRARLDRLQLLGVTDQHDFRAYIPGMGQHSLHLAGADHAGLVDHQHVTGSKLVTPLRPAMLQASDGARRNARSAFQILGRDPGQRRTAHLIALALPRLARDAQHR